MRKRLIKPDPAIYHLLLERFEIDRESVVYIDDSKPNVATADTLGMHGIHFRDAAALADELQRIGLVRQ